MDNRRVYIFDSTLRDGAQARGISFSLSDKLNMLKLLDSLGIDYIEAGNPASNPKEKAFFEKAKDVELRYAKLTAFGSTRRKNSKIEEDPGIQALLSADTETVAIFGKSWDLHVTHVLQTTLEENLSMVKDTLSFFKEKGKEVIFDAEHFFDGYKANPDYAMRVLEAAEQGGADCLVLCDTNGGTLTHETEEIVKAVIKNTKTMVGIHAHNDSETAVSNSIAAVLHGARHVQGTLIGFGERCGNARLTSIIPNLQLKMGYRCIPEDKMILLSSVAREAAEISNAALDEKLPYIGQDAFAHKGGMHIDGVRKVKESFEHIKPEWVGNKRNFLISEVAGRSALVLKLHVSTPISTIRPDKISMVSISFTRSSSSFSSFTLTSAISRKTDSSFFNILTFFTSISFFSWLIICPKSRSSAHRTMVILDIFGSVVTPTVILSMLYPLLLNNPVILYSTPG
jgi:2-isopropylmalate synthase